MDPVLLAVKFIFLLVCFVFNQNKTESKGERGAHFISIIRVKENNISVGGGGLNK